MSQDTKNVIALIFVVICLIALVVLITPQEVIDAVKKVIKFFFRLE